MSFYYFMFSNEIQRLPVDMESSFQPLSLDVFSLIIFDESHHSKDDHPYNVLMAHYHQMKQTGTNKRKLPQVLLGLATAFNEFYTRNSDRLLA
jgi:hypothetical protein